MPRSSSPRRHPGPADDTSAKGVVLGFGSCVIRPDTREVLLAGKAQPVRSRVFDLLMYLLRRRPAVVSREEVLQQVWGRTAVSDSLVSRTVVEARRVIGDDPVQPRMLLNVRGSGYRFAAKVATRPGLHDNQAGLVEQEPRACLQLAAIAYEQHDDPVEAFRHAERACALAERAGLNVERGRALAWLGWLALRGQGPLVAAQFVSEAMAVARSEEHAVLLAQAQLADARVRLAVGDLERALHQLNEAYPLFADPGLEGHRYRCENILATVHWLFGHHEASLEWYRRSQHTATTWPNRSCRIRSCSNEVTTLLEVGDRHERAAEPEAAMAAWSTAMKVLRDIARDPVIDTLPTLRAQLLSHEAGLLARAGRFDEAMSLQQQAEQPFSAPVQASDPLHLDRNLSLRLRRVDLLYRQGELEPALRLIEDTIGLAERHDERNWLPELYDLGSRVAEAGARLPLALHWARQRHQAFTGLQSQRSLKLARMLELDANVDKIRRESDAALRRAVAAEASLSRLRRQLHAMELSLLKYDGRAAAVLLDFVARNTDGHHDAIQRGLPFWMLRIGPTPGDTRRPAEPAAVQPLPVGDGVRLGDDSVLVALGSVGRARAEQQVASLLPGLVGTAVGPAARRKAAAAARLQWIDAAGFDSLAAAIAALRHEAA